MDHLDVGCRRVDIGFALTVEAKFLVIALHLDLGIDLDLISREIITDGIHDLGEKLITQSAAAEVGGGDHPAEGDQAGRFQVDPGVGGNLAV